jgi:transcriptional regulator with XRE-family HTH domain
MYANQKKELIIRNTEYLLKKTNENKLSFSQKSGITRSTVYKLLNGEIKRSQTTTIEKIADFFGVTVEMLETIDIESLDISEKVFSYDGNRNPVCVPVIPEKMSSSLITMKIGELLLDNNLTFCYSEHTNIICLLLDKDKPPFYEKGEKLFIRRYYRTNDDSLYAFIKKESSEVVISKEMIPSLFFLGSVFEERY